MSMEPTRGKPIIGITSDATGETFQVSRAYSTMIADAGGTPVILPCLVSGVENYIQGCNGFVFTGGDDPIMERWGIATHPKAKKIDPERQEFELALLEALDHDPDKPVLGVCLGMQLMGLHAGGKLDQYLPDTLDTAAAHWGKKHHDISGELGRGEVQSHHRQALTETGKLSVVATAPDGVIEAIRDEDRPFYLGVQWHPERSSNVTLGFELFEQLVKTARRVNTPGRESMSASKVSEDAASQSARV